MLVFCAAARGTTMPTTAGWLTATTTRPTTGGTTTASACCLPCSSERDGFPVCEQVFVLLKIDFSKHDARVAFY